MINEHATQQGIQEWSTLATDGYFKILRWKLRLMEMVTVLHFDQTLSRGPEPPSYHAGPRRLSGRLLDLTCCFLTLTCSSSAQSCCTQWL